jgi:hypothetical protein
VVIVLENQFALKFRKGKVFPCLTRSIFRVIRINGNEMGRACDTRGGEGKCILGFGGETRKKETAWKTRRR